RDRLTVSVCVGTSRETLTVAVSSPRADPANAHNPNMLMKSRKRLVDITKFPPRLKNSINVKCIFSQHRQTGEREAVIAMTRSFPYGCTNTLTANHPKTGSPKFPENRENNREF